MYKLILWLAKWLDDKNKVLLANEMLSNVSIGDKIAEEMIIKIVKSSGNRVSDFIIKD